MSFTPRIPLDLSSLGPVWALLGVHVISSVPALFLKGARELIVECASTSNLQNRIKLGLGNSACIGKCHIFRCANGRLHHYIVGNRIKVLLGNDIF